MSKLDEQSIHRSGRVDRAHTDMLHTPKNRREEKPKPKWEAHITQQGDTLWEASFARFGRCQGASTHGWQSIVTESNGAVK